MAKGKRFYIPLLGFRSRRWWKMLIASIYYVIIGGTFLTGILRFSRELVEVMALLTLAILLIIPIIFGLVHKKQKKIEKVAITVVDEQYTEIKPNVDVTTALNQSRIMGKAIEKELLSSEFGKEIFGDIQLFGSNVGIPKEYDDIASLMAFRTLMSGERPRSLAKELQQRFPELNYEETYLAMLTKCSIASSARTKYRALRMGRKWYIWSTAGDGDRVRKSHQTMEGIVCNWNDPPNPENLLNGSEGKLEHPGYADKCRCIALPVISFDDLQFPVKVHIAGKIEEIATIEEFNAIDQTIRKYVT